MTSFFSIYISPSRPTLNYWEGSVSLILAQRDLLYRELLTVNPADFSTDSSTLEKLVRMQHYGLPTRLLDITSNPLVALFFACRSHHDVPGEVVVFKVKRADLKFFDSDIVSCIANIARLPHPDKDGIDFSKTKTEFNGSLPIQRLLHFIREEKSYFVDKIEPSDLKKIICIKSKMSSARILSQSGAFFLFGLNAVLEESGRSGIDIERIAVTSSGKQRIIKELDDLSINESTIFPYIENSAKYIAKKYINNQGHHNYCQGDDPIV